MKVFMIGGTGLLGSQAADELIKRGHEVKTLALPPLPVGAKLNPKMEIEFGNYLDMSDEEIEGKMKGCEGFVFAAGVDERVEKRNITLTQSLVYLPLAKKLALNMLVFVVLISRILPNCTQNGI